MKFTGVRMTSSVLTLVVLLAGVAVPALARGDDDGPIDKVVTLLEGLEADLQNDEKAEQEIYDKYACWCEETTQRKSSDIESGKSEMKRLGQEILKQKGTVAVRTQEIKELNKKLDANEKAQAKATSSRKKENQEWQDETAETSQAMTAINSAMQVLLAATKPALLQQDATAKLQASMTKIVDTLPTKVLAALPSEKLSAIRSFAQLHGKASYAPQSMTIQGILGDMYLTMGVNVQDATATEARRNRAFEDYMHEKTKEHAEMTAIKEKKQREKAEAETMLAEASEAYDDASKQLEADVKFFDITKKACQAKTVDWQERHRLRADEIEGIQEALKILTSDEAKKMFKEAIKPGMETMFLQVDSTSTAPQEKIYGKLKDAATKTHSLRLAALAARVRTVKSGHFDEVLKAIDALIAVLADEQKSDTKIRNECQKEYQDIERKTKDLEWKIENNEKNIKKIENTIEDREDEKEATIKQIKETEDEIKKMKEERTKENKEFIQAKKVDEASIVLLKKAREAMMDFYKKEGVKMGKVQGSVKLLQELGPDDAPDATFSDKGKRKNQSKGIVSIMTMVIEDLGSEITNGVKAEEEAQLAFEEALAAAEKLVKDLTEKKVNLEAAIAKLKDEKEAEEEDKKENEGDLDDVKKHQADIKEDCDYMLEKYEERRGYRDAETEALRDAKEFLSTYYDSEEAAFVQKPSSSFSGISFSHLRSGHLRK